MCPSCRRPIRQCACRAASTPAPSGSKIRVVLDRKGRAGKGVTVVRGLPLESAALGALGKQLRAACGSGGTVKDGNVEVQGDHRDRVVAWLVAQGWAARRGDG